MEVGNKVRNLILTLTCLPGVSASYSDVAASHCNNVQSRSWTAAASLTLPAEESASGNCVTIAYKIGAKATEVKKNQSSLKDWYIFGIFEDLVLRQSFLCPRGDGEKQGRGGIMEMEEHCILLCRNRRIRPGKNNYKMIFLDAHTMHSFYHSCQNCKS